MNDLLKPKMEKFLSMIASFLRLPERSRSRSVFVFFLLLVFIMYGQTLFGDFVFDDRGIVEHAAVLSDASSLDSVFLMPYWSQAAGLYRPVTLVSYALNFLFFGGSPFWFHLANLILYAASGFFLFVLVKRLSASELLAILAGTLFLVLPIHTEVVANIIGRAEIFALLFSLLFLLEILRDSPRAGLAALYAFLAIGSKEIAIAVLPIAFLAAYLKERAALFKMEKLIYPAPLIPNPLQGGDGVVYLDQHKPAAAGRCWSRRWVYYRRVLIASGAGISAYFLLRFFVLGGTHSFSVETSFVENPLVFADTISRVATAFKVFGMYIAKSFLPVNLCSDYSYNQIPVLRNFFDAGALGGFFAFLFLIASVPLFLRRFPVFSFAAGWIVFSFLPVSNFIFPIGTIAGERLIFYPSVGLILLFALFFRAFANCFRSSRFMPLLAVFVAACVISAYATAASARASAWLTEKELFQSAALCSPNSVLSASNLGAAYYLEGDLDAAKKELLRAQEIYGKYSKGVNNLGLVYWKKGEREKARALFRAAALGEFPYSGGFENLALMSLEEGHIKEAREWLLQFYGGNEAAAAEYIARKAQVSR